MNKILFQSLYNDLDFTTLKHCIFYFGSIDIPDLSMPVAWGENNSNTRFLKTIPEDAHEHIDYLTRQGIVNQVDVLKDTNTDVFDLSDMIVNEINNSKNTRSFSPSDINEISSFLNINKEDPEFLKTVDSISIILASTCLSSLRSKDQVCCIDNKLIFDSLNLGIRKLIKSQLYDFDQYQINKWKTTLLAKNVITLNLPSFKFHSFDDVLELRHKFRENILALDNHLTDISKKIEGVPWEKDFQYKITEFYNKKIQPDISDLRKNANSSPFKIANRIYDAGFSNLALSLAFYAVFPTKLREIVMGISAKTLLDVIKQSYQETNKAIAYNPYSIFLNISNR